MINIIHIPTGRDGMRRGGMKSSSGRGSRNRKTAIRFLTWKDMAERRNEVMNMVYIYKLNGGRTTDTRNTGKQGTPPLRREVPN